MAELKTAKDMPEGSRVTYHQETWIANEPGSSPRRRTSVRHTIQAFNEAEDYDIDRWLANGAIIEFIPAGRGRWLKQEEEARRG